MSANLAGLFIGSAGPKKPLLSLSRSGLESFRGSCKTPIWGQIRAFNVDSFSSQIAYSQLSMSICEENESTLKSSNLASKESFAIPSLIHQDAQVVQQRQCFGFRKLGLLDFIREGIDRIVGGALEIGFPQVCIMESATT